MSSNYKFDTSIKDFELFSLQMEDIDLPLKKGSLSDIEKSQSGSSNDVDESNPDAMEVDSSQVCFSIFIFCDT